MIRVLFFARLREQVGCASIELEFDENLATVAALRQLISARGQQWADALSADNILCAVNQVQADPGSPVTDGDEVAFFPPVTGG